MDQAGDQLLMAESRLEQRHGVRPGGIGLVYSLQDHRLVVVEQILIEELGVIPLLLRLYLIPVGEAVQAHVREGVGELQIKIGGIPFLIDLPVEKFHYGFMQHMTASLL